MKTIILNTLLLLLLIGGQFTTTQEQLKGKWTIDLRPTPASKAYYQVFEVTAIDGKTFSGTFYGSPVKGALINSEWDRLYFAFSTSDNTHTYYHSGSLHKGKLSGISYCPGRKFTAPWNSVKKE